MIFHKTMFGFTFIIILSACVGPAPVISRPDNLVIECSAKCKFSVPMNDDIVVARATNFNDAIKSIGSNLLDLAPIAAVVVVANKGLNELGKAKGPSNETNTVNTSTTTNTSAVGDTTTTTSGDQITGDTGSGNTTSGDVANTSGDTVTGDKAGGNIDKSAVTTTNSNAFNNNSNQGNNPTP